MADIDNKESFANNISSGIRDVSGSLKDYEDLLGNISKLTGANKDKADAFNRSMADQARNVTGLNKETFQAIKNLREMRRSVDELNKAEEQHQKHLKAVKFLSAGWKDQIATIAGVASKGAAQVAKFGNSLSKLTAASSGKGMNFGLKGIAEELTKINRASFEASKQAQMMGQTGGYFTKDNWDKVKQGITLSRSEFTKLHVDMNRRTLGLNFDKETALASVKKIQEAFGFDPKVVSDVVNRMVIGGEKLIAGFKHKWQQSLMEGGKAGMEGLPQMAHAMLLKGGDIAQIEQMFQAQTKNTKKQTALMEYEKAVNKKNQAIDDMNAKTGQNSQDVLIGIEKLMTKLVATTDKLLNSFSLLPKALVGLQALGLASIGSMAVQMASLTSTTLNATRAMQGLGAASQVTGASRMTGMLGAGPLGLGGNLAVGLGAAGMAYGGYKMYTGSKDWHGAKDWKERRAAEDSMGTGMMMAGAGTGALIGSIVPVVGTIAGAIIGGGIGWGADKLMNKGGASDSVMESMDTLKQHDLFKDASFSDVENEGEKAIGERIRRYHRDAKKYAGTQRGRESAQRRDMMIASVEHRGGSVQGTINKSKKLDAEGANASAIHAAYKARNKENEAVDKGLQLEFRKLKITHLRLAQLNQIATAQKNLAANTKATMETMSSGGFGLVAVYAKESVKYSKAYLETLKATKETTDELTKSKGFKRVAHQSVYSQPLQAHGLDEGSTAEVIDMLMKTKGNKIEEKLEDRLGKRGVDEEVIKNVLKYLEKSGAAAAHLADKTAKMLILEDEINKRNLVHVGLLTQIGDKLTEITKPHEQKLLMQEKFLNLAKSETQLTEKTVAGHAMSFKARMKEYSILKTQSKEAVAMTKVLRVEERKAVDNALQDEGFKGKFGGILEQFKSGTEAQKRKAFTDLQTAYQSLPDEQQNNEKNMALYMDIAKTYEKRIDGQMKVNELVGKERDMILGLKEGYLDVINQMTTGSDLVSKLMPDAQRGIVALHQFSMAKGEKQGGALKRGFLSLDMAGMTDLSKATKFTPHGLQGSTRDTLMMKRHRQRLKIAAQGPQHGLSGQESFERGSVVDVNQPRGEGAGLDAKMDEITGRSRSTPSKKGQDAALKANKKAKLSSSGAGTMKVNTLILNGKVIGRDLKSAPNDALNKAMEDQGG